MSSTSCMGSYPLHHHNVLTDNSNQADPTDASMAIATAADDNSSSNTQEVERNNRVGVTTNAADSENDGVKLGESVSAPNVTDTEMSEQPFAGELNSSNNTKGAVSDSTGAITKTGEELNAMKCAIIPYGIKDPLKGKYPEAVKLYYDEMSEYLAGMLKENNEKDIRNFLQHLFLSQRFAKDDEELSFWAKIKTKPINEKIFLTMEFSCIQVDKEKIQSQESNENLLKDQEYKKLIALVKKRMDTQANILRKKLPSLSSPDVIIGSGVKQHEVFPMGRFESLIKAAETNCEIRLLNTFICNLNGVGKEKWSQLLGDAAKRDVKIKILLCHPESPFATARTLGHCIAHPEFGNMVNIVQNGVLDNLENLSKWNFKNLEVRLYQPSTSSTVYQVGQTIFGGILFIQKDGFAKPQFETTPHTKLGEGFSNDFTVLWEHETTREIHFGSGDLEALKASQPLSQSCKRMRSDSVTGTAEEVQNREKMIAANGTKKSKIIYHKNPKIEEAVEKLADVLVSHGLSPDDEYVMYQLKKKHRENGEAVTIP